MLSVSNYNSEISFAYRLKKSSLRLKPNHACNYREICRSKTIRILVAPSINNACSRCRLSAFAAALSHAGMQLADKKNESQYSRLMFAIGTSSLHAHNYIKESANATPQQICMIVLLKCAHTRNFYLLGGTK
jgi:hypothetical protein